MLVHRRKTKVAAVAAELEKRIAAGELGRETPLATATELAREFGVSAMTADRAVKTLVAAGRLRRVKGRGTFVCEAAKRWQIAMLTDLDSPGYYPGSGEINNIYNRSALAVFQAADCDVRFITFSALTGRNFSPRMLDKVDGILFSACFCDGNSLDFCRDFSGQVVLFRGDEPTTSAFFHQVLCDFRPALRAVFAALPHPAERRYIIIQSGGETRQAALRAVAGEFGVAPERFTEHRYDFSVGGRAPQLEGYKFGMEVRLTPETVIFTTSDFTAFGIIDAFDKRGLKAGDYELISIDNLEARGIGPFERPRLTTIDHPKEALTRRAAQLLLTALDNAEKAKITIQYPATLVRRESALTKLGKPENNA